MYVYIYIYRKLRNFRGRNFQVANFQVKNISFSEDFTKFNYL